MNFELGIPEEQIPLSSLTYLTRIHYSASGGDQFGEHEIDYILMCQLDAVTLHINQDEVSETRWVSADELRAFLASAAAPNNESSGGDSPLITPWFRFIAHRFLWPWWDGLHELEKFRDVETIHRAGQL